MNTTDDRNDFATTEDWIAAGLVDDTRDADAALTPLQKFVGSHPNHPIGSCDRCATDPGINGIADPDWDEPLSTCDMCSYLGSWPCPHHRSDR